MNPLLSIFTSGLLLASAACLTACGDDKSSNGGVEFADGDFKVSRTEVALLNDEPQSITVRAGVKPSVSSDATWLNISAVTASNGANLYTFSLSADANTTYDERKATVSVTAGSERASIAVTQFGAETVEVSTAAAEGTLDPAGGTFTLKYKSTSAVSITAPSWLTPVTSKSLSEGEASYVYAANMTGVERGGDFLITLASTPSISATFSVTQASLPPTDDMPSTAVEIARNIVAGVNIGNTLECPGTEGSWSGQKVNLEYVRGLKTLGFNAVRVPCAWDSHVSDRSTNTIDPAWLDRVDEVVGMIVGEGMYAIVNIHWDGGWLEESVIKGYDEAVDKKQRDYWTQIATKLNHYDEHLLLAGMNEPGVQEQDKFASKSLQALMTYQQTFLDAVRATGGNNARRVLVMQAPYTNIAQAVKADFKLPTDVVADRMMCEVHYYDPYQFNMMSEDASWGKMYYYWGADNHVAGSNRNTPSSMEEQGVKNEFKKIRDTYASRNIPVILGEYAVCEWRQGYKDIDVDKWWASRNLWTEVVTREAKNHGLVPFYWETNGDINRIDGRAKTNVFDAIRTGAAAGTYPW
ncbi:MAG: cellulase family glycosylhydrolase [Duncaniella sp.]|nr:cellulase family glycosylhydrolase [Duncaniella sp.]